MNEIRAINEPKARILLVTHVGIFWKELSQNKNLEVEEKFSWENYTD